jgi:TRAP-type mannitol/chloroaromatic compound transport system permease small subunit
MTALRAIADAIDAFNDRVGRTVAWLVLAVVGMLFVQVPLREIFHGGHNTANDVGQLIHATVFMVGAAYAMRHDAHVRVDIFHQRLSPRARAAVELVGTVFFLLPWLALLGWYSVPIVLNSVGELEQFAETYTPGYYLMKLLLFVFVALVSLQAIATTARALIVLAAPAGANRHSG